MAAEPLTAVLPRVSARVTSACGHTLATQLPFMTSAMLTTRPGTHTATGAAKDRIRMLSRDCTAIRGCAARILSRHSATKAAGGAAPRPRPAPTAQVRSMTTICIAAAGAVMTRVLAAATATGLYSVVRIVFQLVPRCSGRHDAAASRARPREQKNIP